MIQPPPSASPARSVTLEDAWLRFARFDKNAVLAQRRFISQQKWILSLGVSVTILAIVYSVLEPSFETGLPWLQPPYLQWVKEILHFCTIATPITLSILVAWSVKFNLGGSWIGLRGAAEALRKEIYRYRMQVEEYSPNRPATRDVQLAIVMKTISKRLMETNVNQAGMEPYEGPLPPKYGATQGDDGFSDLNAEQYLTFRVEDQINYYQKKALRLSRELRRFQWIILIMGGVSTLLAALGFNVWVAVSSALATAFANFLEFKRVETNLTSCNTAANDLYDIRTWWHALSSTSSILQSNVETLVSSTEAVIQSENAGWVQEMREALSKIYGDKKEDEENQELAQGMVHPSALPSGDGSLEPPLDPSLEPSLEPSADPSVDPSLEPSFGMSMEPSLEPSFDSSMETTASAPSGDGSSFAEVSSTEFGMVESDATAADYSTSDTGVTSGLATTDDYLSAPPAPEPGTNPDGTIAEVPAEVSAEVATVEYMPNFNPGSIPLDGYQTEQVVEPVADASQPVSDDALSTEPTVPTEEEARSSAV